MATARAVVLVGGSPWGFRIKGGVDCDQPLYVSRVNPGGKAAQRNVKEGEFLTSINGQSTRNLTNSEAHALLKRSDNTLELGLNGDSRGDPNRRHYHTIHEETLQETYKKSSLISYTLKKTVETVRQGAKSNSNGNAVVDPRENKQLASSSNSSCSTPSTLVADGNLDDISTDRAIASPRSSYSDCTTPSNSSLNFEEGIIDASGGDMNGLSKSQKRRQRRKNKKVIQENSPVKEQIIKSEYKVESPTELSKKNVQKDKKKSPVKSKSLDDDDLIKIQELSEISENEENKTETNAIISEISDQEEEKNPLKESTNSLLSPEEEERLRTFLESLNLVNSPEESAKQTYNAETLKTKKAQKRKELEEYFLPICQNPRYLEVISEENSDHSDKETPNSKHHLKRGTPELEVPPKVPKRRSVPRIFTNQVQQEPPKLVGTKVFDFSEDICNTTKIPESQSGVEVVFLEDSSNNSSPEEIERDSEPTSHSSFENSLEEDSKEETMEEKIPTNQTESPQVVTNNFDCNITSTKVELSPNETEVTSTSSLSNFVIKIGKEDNVNPAILSQLTPPPTPENTTPKNEPCDTQTLLNFISRIKVCISKEDAVELKKIREEKLFKNLPSELKAKVDEVIENKEESPVHINVITPSNASPRSSTSSSRESSLCTAKYNPTSSIADVSTLTKEEENDKELLQPPTLRETVLKYIISLPFGSEILQELADVSKTIDSYTSSIPMPNGDYSKSLPNISYTPAFMQQKPAFNDISGVAARGMSESWTALPTEKNLAVCLSPKQKEELERTKKTPREAEKLLELHEKFVNRRSCREEEIKRHVDERVTITSVEKIPPPVPTRLLAIIKEEPIEENPTTFEARDYVYPRQNEERLKAKNLNEWLQLARKKSSSESNLNTVHIPLNNLRRNLNQPLEIASRRQSLPYELYEKQMLDLMEKEREIQRELEQLEEEKRKLNAEMAPSRSREFRPEDFKVSKRGDFAEIRQEKKANRPNSMPVMPTEFFRQQMYEEYMNKVSERQERKQHKVIKISSSHDLDSKEENKSKEIIHPIHLEDEFMTKVKQKAKEGRLELKDDSTDEHEEEVKQIGDEEINKNDLPKHIKEFMDITNQPQEEDGVWSPGQQRQECERRYSPPKTKDEPISPVWTPKSANSSPTSERKEFKPVNFQSPVLGRRTRTVSEGVYTPDSTTSEPPWKSPDYRSEQRLPNSHSTPGFTIFSRLPRAQNPTITLLQKAREGQLPRGSQYIEERRPLDDRPPTKYPGEIVYQIKNEYASESDTEKPRRMAELGPRKFEGVGPVTKDGMPLILRSEVKEKDQSKWYKRMYETIHKQKPHRDEYVTVKYKQKRAQYPYTSGYLSEPEPGAYDSDFTDYRYTSLDRRRERPIQEFTTSTMPRNGTNRSNSSSDIIKNTQEFYKNTPGRIENYMPGHSSISDKEAKQWWDEVMDIFDGHLDQQRRAPQPHPKSFINQALRESGYESDSTLIFRKKEDASGLQLSPKEQKEAYKTIQKGGDVPLHGLRKLAPEKPKESPRRYLENEVTIHYKTPIRQEIKGYVSEDELASRQVDNMKKLYQEERRKKYLQVSKSLQELQDMNSRRHTDNFIPSQKSPIALNRYDDFDDLSPTARPKPRSPEPRLVARALYNFVGQTPRELTFRKGDLVYLRRQVDKNWYEGELNAMVGLFPVNYVEIVPYESSKPSTTVVTTPRKPHEGQARAKYNFIAQTHLELSLAKGELVTITRRVDNNWFEGKIGGRKGIFPVSYVEILIDPKEPPSPNTKPVAAPAAHSLLLNGSSQGKESMGSHLYTPHLSSPQLTSSYHAKPIQITGSGTYGSLERDTRNPVDQALHIDTHSEPTPYRALYKYNPQNDDELELLEGDTVYVLEKCDDGWYVGSSDRTGAFGTFPGNYVERV